jgi:hypothetical protein
MKKSAKIALNSEQKSIISDAMNSPENEQLDLYKAIFGGKGGDCDAVGISKLHARSAPYASVGTFTQVASV